MSVLKLTDKGLESIGDKEYVGDNDISDAKYAWEMRQLDYQQIKAIEKTGSPHVLDAKDGDEHGEIVQWALKQGKPVPDDVLEDYPELKEAQKQKVPTEKTTSTINLLTGDEWFKQHPEKILGEQYQTTDRFGKPVTKVKGDADNIIQGINVPSANIAEESIEALETEIKEPLQQILNDPMKKENILRVINKTKKEHAEKVLKKLSGDKESISDAGCPEEYLCFDDVIREYNKGISDEEIKAWIWYKRTTGGFNYEKTILDSKNGWSKYVVPLGAAH